MKLFHALSILLFTAVIPVVAQEKPGKKTMIFQPGAKQPDGHKSATPAPAKPVAAPVATAPAAAAAPAPTTPALPPVDLTSMEAPAQLAARFFAALEKNDVEGAYDGLTKNSKIAERPEESKALRTKTREAIDVFGAVIGFELVDSKNVGERLLRRTYLSLGKEFPLRWRFYFYKPDLVWRLVDLRVDDRLTGIFEEPEESQADAKP